MNYGNIQNVTKPVSRIIFGTSNPAFNNGTDCSEILDELVRMGVTTFDTARVYGQAERVLGNWMSSRKNRENLVIISKGGHPALFIPRLTERAIRKDLAISCQKLQTDFIDVYLLHRDNPRQSVSEFVEILNALHAEGKIGAFGGSNWTHQRLEQANEYAYKKGLVPFTVSSPYFGLADMKGDPFGNGAVSISGVDGAEARAWYKKTDMAMLAYSVLGSGFFSGKVQKPSDMKGWVRRAFASKENFERLSKCQELAQKKGYSTTQIALAWMLKQDLNGYAIVTSSSSSRMKQNVAVLDIELSKEELAYLDLRSK